MKTLLKKRILSFSLAFFMIIGLLPVKLFSVESVSKKVLQVYSGNLNASMEVALGTTKEELGLLSLLRVQVEIVMDDSTTTVADETAEVIWQGDYAPGQAGVYELRAAFVNTAYQYAGEMPVVQVKVMQGMPMRLAGAKNGTTNGMINLIDINAITSALFEVKMQGASNFEELPLPEGTVLHVGDEVHIQFHYTKLTEVSADNIYYFDIPTGLSAISGQSRGDIECDGRVVGSYWVEDDKVKMQFTDADYLQDTDNTVEEGFVNFYASLNQDAVDQQGVIRLGDTIIGTVPIVPDEEIRNVHVKKWNGTEESGSEGLVYDPARNAVQYTIQFDTNGNTQSIDQSDVVDTLITTVNNVEDNSIVTGDYTDVSITPAGSGATFQKGTDGKYVLHAQNVAPDTVIKVTFRVPVKEGIVRAKFVNDANATKTIGGATSPAGDASVQGSIDNTLQIQKQAATPVFDPATRKTTVVYTVTVTAPSTNTTAIADTYIEDVFTENGQLVNGITKISGDGNMGTLGTIEGKPGFTTTLGTMNPGDVRTFSYSADLDSEACYFDNTPSDKKLTNRATVKSADTAFGNSSSSAVFNKRFTEKAGIYDATTNLFRFTATFDGRIPGTTDQYYDGVLKSIDDLILTNSFTFAGTPAPVLEAFQGDNVIRTKTLNGSDFEGKSEWSMDIPADMVGPYSYRLIYYVRLPDGYVAGQNDTVDNRFTARAIGIGAGGQDLTFQSESTTSAQGTINNSLEKWLDRSSGTYTSGNHLYSLQKYQVDVKSPILRGATLTDWVEQKADSYFDIKFPIDFLKENMSITFEENALVEGEDYTIEAVGSTNDQFKITFLKNFPTVTEQNRIKVRYEGQVVASEKGLEIARNEAGVSKISQGSVVVHNKAELNNNGMTVTKDDGGADLGSTIEKNAVDTTNMEGVAENVICWKIKLTAGFMHAFGSGYHPLVDTLPSNQELIKVEHYTDSQTPRECIRNDSGTLGNHEYTVSDDGQTVTINAYSAHRNHPESYLIWTRLKDSELIKEGINPDNFDNQVFTNSAYYETAGAKWNVSASKEVSVHRNSKTFEYTGGTEEQGGVSFTLTINKDGVDLDSNSNTITIHDTMNRQLTLNKDTLRINGMTVDQVPGASLSYQEGSNKFDLVLPDSTPCEITYMASIDAEVGEAGWLENTAQIEGRIDTITAGDLETRRLDMSAGTVSIYSFYIKKTDGNDKLLSNAKFILKKVTLENGQINETPMETASNVGGISLDSGDGTYKFRGVKKTQNTFNCVYSVQETEAPAGCVKDENVYYIAFGNNVEPELKAALETKGVRIRTAHTGQGANLDTMFTMENSDEEIQVSVHKIWDDGNDAGSLRPSSVTIKLKADGEVVRTQEVTGEGNTWTYEFQNLPSYKTLDDTTRQRIEYTVEEVAVTGYDTPEITGSASNGYSIINKRDVPSEANQQFNGNKTLTEEGQPKDITAGQFRFTVTAGENNPAEITGLPEGEMSVGADGSFALGTLSFPKAGIYTFIVSEVNGGVAGYIYDDKAVTVTVPVTLNTEDNVLEIGTVTYQKDGSDADGISFANTYTAPSGASQVFSGSKTLTEEGQPKDITPGQFRFTVTAGGNNPAEITGLPTGEMSVGADGSFALGTLSFPKAGTYTFMVSEVNSGAAGYTYDDKAVTVTVPVTLNEQTNILEIGTVTYQKDGSETNGISFANTYTAPSGAGQEFGGSKNLTEAGQPKDIIQGQFAFTVTAGGNNPAEITGLPTGELPVGADGSFTLGILRFQEEGTYSFTVSEVNGGAAGYTYDDKAVIVTVPVTLNTQTNTLEVGAVTYQKDGAEIEGITFTNTYTTPSEASQEFNGSKTLTEGERIKDIAEGQFRFTVTAGENNPAEITGLPTEELSVGADGSFTLGTLSFRKEGTYTFTVSEVNSGAAGYTYDDKAVTVTVPVTLNTQTNTLEVGMVTYQKDGAEAGGITFANTYTTPSETGQEFNGNKTLTEDGQPKEITEGQFHFVVTAGENNPMAITGLPEREIPVGADGSFSLGTLSFGKEGTYTFLVSEVNSGAVGYTYDDKPVTVTVLVTLNTDTNVLEIGEVTYQKDGAGTDGITFANTYTAPSGASQVFKGSKTLTEDGQPKTITPGQFRFTVTAGENNPAEIQGLPTSEMSVGADGSFALGTLSFTKAGTYTFTVSEVNSGVAGYTYDDKEVTVTVSVALNTETNILEIGTVSYWKDNEEAEGITFANTYTAPSGASQEFNGSKTLTEERQPKDITSGQFRFTVTAGENNPAEIIGLPTNELPVGADGSFALGTLSFPKAGTYTFMVSEVNSGAAGYTYDDKAVTVTVPVALNTDTNVLEIGEVTYQKGGTETDGITFANTYTTPSGASQVFKGIKKLMEEGQPKTITPGQFRFTVTAGGNNPANIQGLPVGEMLVGADGSFALGTLSFTKAGIYTFMVSEVNSGAAGYTYDDKAVTVTVPVVLNTDTNVLEIGEVTYRKDGTETDGITFANTYTTPSGASRVFKGIKNLTEEGQPKDILPGQFRFTVTAGENNPAKINGLPTSELSVGTDGSFTLGTLRFGKEGTYTFTVSEVNGGVAGYTYDDKAVTVTVSVVLNTDTNVLEISEVTYQKDGSKADGITFVNTYHNTHPTEQDRPTKPDPPKTVDTGNPLLWLILLILSCLGLCLTFTYKGKKKK